MLDQAWNRGKASDCDCQPELKVNQRPGERKNSNSISNLKKEGKRTSRSSLCDRAISRVFSLFTRDSSAGSRWKKFIKILVHLDHTPRADPREPLSRFLFARHRRGDKSTFMREIDERYDEQRKRGRRGGSEVLPEFNNHRFFRSTGRRGLDVRHGCNLGG